mmetsp:Transcript_18115/g.40040  ORF Transcript_18115/g.40040 Transcript_18115/m.40040 type:complete len:129 (-) Transcript_18115:104-490(-)
MRTEAGFDPAHGCPLLWWRVKAILAGKDVDLQIGDLALAALGGGLDQGPPNCALGTFSGPLAFLLSVGLLLILVLGISACCICTVLTNPRCRCARECCALDLTPLQVPQVQTSFGWEPISWKKVVGAA